MKHCQVRRHDDCKEGNHQFVVSRWLQGQYQQSASGFTCMRCLLSIDGKNDLEKLRAQINERDLQEDKERGKPSARSKSSKSTSGEKQDSDGQP
jgi:hypothetical protein